MHTTSPLSRIVYLSLPADLKRSFDQFVLDPAILLPVELPAGSDAVDLTSLSWEMMISGMLKVLAWDPEHKDAAYFREFVLVLKPGLDAELTQAAITKASAHDYELAEEIFRAVVGLMPGNCRYLLNLALVLDQRAQNYASLERPEMTALYEEQAARWYSNALSLDDVLSDTYLYAGHFHLRMSDNERAIDLFRSFLKYDPEHPEAERIEKVLFELEKNNLADQEFKEAFDFIRMGKEQEGLTRIDAFLAKNPDVWNAHFMKGWAMRRLGKYAEGIDCFKESIRLGGTNADTLNELAICLMESKQYAESRRALEQALKLDPENVKIISNLGILALKQEHTEEARGFFLTVLAYDEEDSIAKQYLSLIDSKA